MWLSNLFFYLYKNIFYRYIFFFTDKTAGKNSTSLHASRVRTLALIEDYAIRLLSQVPGLYLTGSFRKYIIANGCIFWQNKLFSIRFRIFFKTLYFWNKKPGSLRESKLCNDVLWCTFGAIQRHATYCGSFLFWNDMRHTVTYFPCYVKLVVEHF